MVAAVCEVCAVVPLRNGVIVIDERFLPPLFPSVQVTVTSVVYPEVVAVPIVGACGAVVAVTALNGVELPVVPKLF